MHRDPRPKRALLSVVVNAHAGNVEALSSRRKAVLSRCGVAGCVCEHFSIADGNSYGVCDNCTHGAMYHAKMSTQKKSNNNDNNATCAAASSSSSSVTASASSSSSASAKNFAPSSKISQEKTGNFLSPSENNTNNKNGNDENEMTANSNLSTTQQYHNNEGENDKSNNNNHPDNFKNDNFKNDNNNMTMSLTAVLAQVDNLERSAVLKTFRCEDDSSMLLSRSTRCNLLSQALTCLVRASDLINERLAGIRREILKNSRNPNNEKVQAAESEKSILQRRMEQLGQHCEKVRTMLSAIERKLQQQQHPQYQQQHHHHGEVEGEELESGGGGGNGSENFIGAPSASATVASGFMSHNYNNNNNRRGDSVSSTQSHGYNLMMMMNGPVEDDRLSSSYCFDDMLTDYGGASAAGGNGHGGFGGTSASRAASLANTTNYAPSATNSAARDRFGNLISSSASACGDFASGGGGSTSKKDKDSNGVRLCRDCLETTPVNGVFCHNCGKPAARHSNFQIRAPSPDPILHLY